MDSQKVAQALRLFDLLTREDIDRFDALRMAMDQVRTDGLSTSPRQTMIALDAFDAKVGTGQVTKAARAAAMATAVTAGLAANPR